MKKNSKKFLSTIIVTAAVLAMPLAMQVRAMKTTTEATVSKEETKQEEKKKDEKKDDDKDLDAKQEEKTEEKEDKFVLVTKEKEIKKKFNELTGMKVKKLLYRASKDGFKAKDFHSKCDGYENTVVIVKIRNGDIIGGYASEYWKSTLSWGYVTDDKAFLFSLTKNKIEPFNQISMHNDYGPCFCGVLDICDNCNIYENSWCRIGYKNGNDYKMFIGCTSSTCSVHFGVDDYEVYEVE